MSPAPDEAHLPDGMPLLTAAEKALVVKLAECLTDTVYLDEPLDESSRMRFMHGIHDLQTIIMARAAMRAYPKLFRFNGGKSE